MIVDPETIEAVLISVVTGQALSSEDIPRDHCELASCAAPVARVAWEGGQHRVVALACHRAAHGLRGGYAQIQAALDTLSGIHLDPADCDTCGGTGWIPAATDAARRVASAALLFRHYAGGRLPEDTAATKRVARDLDVGGIVGAFSLLRGGA